MLIERALNELRSIKKLISDGEIPILSVTTTPNLFEIASEWAIRVDADRHLKFPKDWPSNQTFRFVESTSGAQIGGVGQGMQPPQDWKGTLEAYLLHTFIKPEFERHGGQVIEGLPNRYERGWVI